MDEELSQESMRELTEVERDGGTTIGAADDSGRGQRTVLALVCVIFGLLAVIASISWGYLEYTSPPAAMMRDLAPKIEADLESGGDTPGLIVDAEPIATPSFGETVLMQPWNLIAVVCFGAAFFLALPKSRPPATAEADAPEVADDARDRTPGDADGGDGNGGGADDSRT